MPLSSGITRVIRGGTGVSTLGDAGVLIGNGTGAVQVAGAGTSGQVLTSNGAGVDPTFQAAGGGGLTFVAIDATERTTVSTTEIDLSTISGLSITAGTRVRIVGKARKTSGAAAVGTIGLKINSTVVANTSNGNYVYTTSGTDREENGEFEIEFEVGETNYQSNIRFNFSNKVSSTGANISEAGEGNSLDALIPAATITSIVLVGKVANASITLAVNDVRVYTYANN